MFWKYNVGDKVLGEVVEDVISGTILRYQPGSELTLRFQVIEIIAQPFVFASNLEESGYLVIIPEKSGVNGWIIEESHCKNRGVDSTLVGRMGWGVSQDYLFPIEKEKEIKKIYENDGLFCVECQNFCTMAEANLPSGKFVCWSCRDSKAWKYSRELLDRR